MLKSTLQIQYNRQTAVKIKDKLNVITRILTVKQIHAVN